MASLHSGALLSSRSVRTVSTSQTRNLPKLAISRLSGRRAAPSTSVEQDGPSSSRPVLARSLFDNKGKGPSDDFGDRILASLPFLLPLLDGLPYGESLPSRSCKKGSLILLLQHQAEIEHGL
jgi:hypothetical protein